MDERAFLAALFHHRWAVPVLGRMGTRGGGRVAELASALDASRGGVRHGLDSLIELGLVRRNPGHGHPLRPEFLLTERGERLAQEAWRIVRLTQRWSIEKVAFRKWPLPVAYGLGEAGARFSELRTRLPGITDRALSDALTGLSDARLVQRVVHPHHPPRVEYLPTDRVGELLPSLCRLAQAA